MTDLGSAGEGNYEGVRVALREPARLVLGESYNRGWKATCDGRSLGKPRVVDGYANGWTAPADCRRVAFAFAPQRWVNWSYVVSALACLLLLGFVALRRPGAETVSATANAPEGTDAEGMPLGRAAIAGLALGVVFGFVFAIRAGVVIGPALTVLLWRGMGARAAALAAGALLLLVPAVYLLFEPEDKGGWNFNYANDLLRAHWLAVGAIVLLGLALWRTLAGRLRRERDGPAP